jgi:hypothetical protein
VGGVPGAVQRGGGAEMLVDYGGHFFKRREGGRHGKRMLSEGPRGCLGVV